MSLDPTPTTVPAAELRATIDAVVNELAQVDEHLRSLQRYQMEEPEEAKVLRAQVQTRRGALDVYLGRLFGQLEAAIPREASGAVPEETSTHDAAPYRSPPASQSDPPGLVLDLGMYLLKPITAEETSSVEVLLGLLWDAAGSASLTAGQEAQVMAIAAMIQLQQRESVPGETERQRLVGAVRSGLWYLWHELPNDVLPWAAVITLLTRIQWSTLAGALGGLAR